MLWKCIFIGMCWKGFYQKNELKECNYKNVMEMYFFGSAGKAFTKRMN